MSMTITLSNPIPSTVRDESLTTTVDEPQQGISHPACRTATQPPDSPHSAIHGVWPGWRPLLLGWRPHLVSFVSCRATHPVALSRKERQQPCEHRKQLQRSVAASVRLGGKGAGLRGRGERVFSRKHCEEFFRKIS